MSNDIQDILFVFLVDNLASVSQRRSIVLPNGLADFIRTSLIESNGSLPFPSDISDILFTYGISEDKLL